MTPPLLSILCVSRIEPYAEPFLQNFMHLADACNAEFVVAVDGNDALTRFAKCGVTKARMGMVKSKGFIESVLDEAVALTTGEYVLRLDDDERASVSMVAWLRRSNFTTANHWSFPRMYLWGDTQHALKNEIFWPDLQTRLSVRHMAGGRYTVHSASPFGIGVVAPCWIEHHKFLVKSLDERRAIAKRYEDQCEGMGTGVFLTFNCPEDFYATMPVYDREAVAA